MRARWFLAAVGLQAAILVAAPVQRMITIATVRVVSLKLAPVDPYDPLRGWYMALRFDVSRPDEIDGWSDLEEHSQVWVELRVPDAGVATPAALHTSMPEAVGEDRALIRGRLRGRAQADWSRLVFGIEQFYLPETTRTEVERILRDQPDQAVADVALDSNGHPAILRLRAADQVFETD